jgi:hypothetical protein
LNHVASQQASEGKGAPPIIDLLKLDKDTAHSVLKNHLTWNPRSSNLVSWTSSILFAIQHALRKSVNGYWPAENSSDIIIYILDTRELPPGSFLPATALLKALEVEEDNKFKHENYHGEYLSQGWLNVPDNAMTKITLKSLEERDLYELYPDFEEKEKKKYLRSRVNELRYRFEKYPKRPTTKKIEYPKRSTAKEIELAEHIAMGCYTSEKTHLVVAFMVALLSLNPRERRDEGILNAFWENGLS